MPKDPGFHPSDPDLLLRFARTLYETHRVDSKPTFSIIIDDPETGEYSVRSRSFVDADRAGFSDYRNKTVMRKLTQTEASRLVELLECAA